ncbi:hypothetical protein [Streptomyces sp. NPDC013489]|uniref:hypothetical protein n=1 Tax=Streptomyces sp. NPDC013489 TaxID=3155606 RepID=UPI0034085D62
MQGNAHAERGLVLKRIGTVAVAAVLVAFVAGCGAQKADEPGQGVVKIDSGVATAGGALIDTLPAAPTKGLAKGLTLPLHTYTISAADGYVWHAAVREQWRSCMARYGFADFGPPSPSLESVTAQVDTAMGRRYGISDLDKAKKYGYHLPDDAPEAPYWEPASGAETAVFTGKGPELTEGMYQGKALPEDGCRGEARRMFPMPQSPEGNKIEAQVFKDSRADANVVAAVEKWASCMKEKGFERKDPLEELDTLGISVSSPSAGEEEIRQAVADVECKQETRLISLWHEGEKRHQQRAIASEKAKLDKEKSAKDAVMGKARKAYEDAAR